MKTIQKNLYSIDELSAEAQKVAIENNRYIDASDGWDQFIIDEKKEELEAAGYHGVKISYSGFWSQGDGASFSCSSVDIEKVLKRNCDKEQLKEYKGILFAVDGGEIDAEVNQSGRYVHEMTMSCNVNYTGEYDPQADHLEDLIREDARRYARKIYKDLETEYEYYTTDEHVKDTLSALGEIFTSNGKED